MSISHSRRRQAWNARADGNFTEACLVQVAAVLLLALLYTHRLANSWMCDLPSGCCHCERLVKLRFLHCKIRKQKELYLDWKKVSCSKLVYTDRQSKISMQNYYRRHFLSYLLCLVVGSLWEIDYLHAVRKLQFSNLFSMLVVSIQA